MLKGRLGGWLASMIPGYMETVTPKIFIFEGSFLMFEYACISPTYLTLYPVVKSENNTMQTIHFVNSVRSSIYLYILGCPGTYYTLLRIKVFLLLTYSCPD
jgi:hypothetical protein